MLELTFWELVGQGVRDSHERATCMGCAGCCREGRAMEGQGEAQERSRLLCLGVDGHLWAAQYAI